MKEERIYKCGCIDTHDSELWASTHVEHCPSHAWDGDRLREPDENPARAERIEFTVAPDQRMD